MFAEPKDQRPSDEVPWMFDDGRIVLDLDNDPIKDYSNIPLTLSSEVEGALMEAIRRLDHRITQFDLWARLSVHPCPVVIRQRLTHHRPKYCKGGEILTPEALNKRMCKFRLENAVTAWVTRGGSPALRQFLWDLMSPTGRAANSTRELRKLSKEDRKQARKGNAGKHASNAGGWIRDQNATMREVSTEAHQEEEGAMIPAVSGSNENKGPQRVSVSNNNGDEEIQSSFYAPDSGGQPHPRKRRKVHEPTLSAMNAPQTRYVGSTYDDASIDRMLRPRSGIHDQGRPFYPSDGVYDILPTQAAVGAFNVCPPSHLVPNGWDRPAGFGSDTQRTDTLAGSWYNRQQAVQAPQREMTHPPIGVGHGSNDSGVQANLWDNGQHILPMAQYQSVYQPIGIEGTLDSHFGGNFAQRTSFEEDVEESFRSTGMRSLANGTFPMQDYPRGEIDYRDIRPRDEEDSRDIHDALAMTKSNFRLRTGNECPPTDTDQSYSDQLRQILHSFETSWPTLGGSFPMPDLIRCQAPWRDGFANWDRPTGGDLEFVEGCFQAWRALHGRPQ